MFGGEKLSLLSFVLFFGFFLFDYFSSYLGILVSPVLKMLFSIEVGV